MNGRRVNADWRAHLAALTFAAACFIQAPAQAQDEEEEAAATGRIEVVGSRIKRTDIEGPEPVIVISSEEIENSGFSTVQEVLDNLTQNTGGGFDSQLTFGFAPSASAVDIRGFGVGRVLVLLDGRRVPVFPLAIGGTINFVDLNSIPSAAVDRIEVLTAGASAIYGSDAISGVINVVLRKDLDGTQVALRYGDTTNGGGSVGRAQLFHGMTTAKSNASVILEYFDLEAIRGVDRDYARADVVTGAFADTTAGPNGNGSIGAFSGYSPAGTLLDLLTGVPIAGPDCTPNPSGAFAPPEAFEVGGSFVAPDGNCRFNRTNFRQLVPESSRFSALLSADRILTPDLTAFARASFLRSEFNVQFEPMAWQPGGVQTGPIVGCNPVLDQLFGPGTCAIFYDADPNDPRDGVPNNPNDISGGAAFLPAITRRLIEYGPRTQEIDNTTWSTLVGLQGVLLNRYDFELGVGHYRIDLNQQNRGYARDSQLLELVQDGTVNLFAPIPDSIVATTRIEPFTLGESRLTTIDFDITGDLFEVPAGMVQWAAVVEWGREEFSDQRDPATLAGDVIATGGTAGAGERKRWGTGMEVLVPLHSSVNLTGAFRWDEYNDASQVGNAVTPRIALEWRPFSNLLVRGHWGESFRAPDLQRLFGAQTRGFLDLVDTPLCEQNGGMKGQPNDPTPADGFNECTAAVISTPVVTGANTALEEEEGEDWGLGVVWNITDDLSITVDYFNVELEGIVSTPTSQFILDNSSLFPTNVIQRRPDAVIPGVNPGGLSQVLSAAQNLAIQTSDGVDALIEYQIQTNRFGTFDFELGATYTIDLQRQIADGQPVLNIAEVPDWRAAGRVDWSYGDWGVTVFGRYLDSYAPFNTAAGQNGQVFFDHVTSYTTFNIQARWQTGWDALVRVGVNNAFDRDPPNDFQDGNAGWPFYNQLYHDPFGRNWFVQYTQNF